MCIIVVIFDYNISWIVNILLKDGVFSLIGRKVISNNNAEFDIILVDATETLIERLKKGSKNDINAKKRHIMKAQIIVGKTSQKIICTAFTNGKTHDFVLFKASSIRLAFKIQAKIGSGHVGIKKLHS